MYGFPCHSVPRYKCSDKYAKYPLPKTCQQGTVDGKHIDSAVWNAFLEILDRPEVVARRVNKMASDEDTRKGRLEGQIVKIEKELSLHVGEEQRLVKAYTAKVISLEQLRIQQEERRKKAKELSEKKIQLQRELGMHIPPLSIASLRNYFQKSHLKNTVNRCWFGQISDSRFGNI